MAINGNARRRHNSLPDPEVGSFNDNVTALDRAEQALREYDFERAHRIALAVVSGIEALPQDPKSFRLLHERATLIAARAFKGHGAHGARGATHDTVSARLKSIEGLISDVLHCAGILLVQSMHFGLLAYGLWRVVVDVLRNLHG